MSGRSACMILGFLMLGTHVSGRATDSYQAEIEKWRLEHETKLKAEDGWLTLAGLHWLRPGANRVGSEAGSDARLPSSAPRSVATFILEGEKVSVQPAAGVKLFLKGQEFQGGAIQTDQGRKPDILSIGDIRLIVIRRGDRFGIRVKDNQSPQRTGFKGLFWAPIDPRWKIQARFESAPGIPKLVMDTIIGTRDAYESPGFAVFEHGGKTYRLQAAREGDKLWFVFRDRTAGVTTAENARELETKLPGPDGQIVLDFNRATNLPCAYTPYATCPIAPKQNRLDLAVEAGELLYHRESQK